MRNLLIAITVLPLASLTCLHATELKLAGVFQDHMLLQRDKPTPVWGWANPKAQVTVEFAGQTKTATVDAHGKWMLKLDPMPASAEPRELVVCDGHSSRFSFHDILVGEVWLASGQSNMGWALQRTPTTAALIPKANDPLLRLGRIPHLFAAEPQADLKGCRWSGCTPEEAGNFSAVAYVFARELRNTLKVPVGVLLVAMPSSTAQAWTPREVLQADLKLAPYLEKKPEKAVADDKKAARSPATACLLYNARIAPLMPFAFRGVIWYQAEGNNGDPERYETLFPAMIQSWRAGWGDPALPFLFVQLPPYKGTSPLMREVQARCAKKVPHTAMVVTLDVGEAENIHPANKEPVGVRLALKARALVYGEQVEHGGPEFESLEIRGDSVLLKFAHAASGLEVRGGELKGFEIAGVDEKYFPARVKLDGATVLLTAPEVKAPKRVRYAWANVPEANLFNREGLPAAPFRSEP